MIRKKLIYIIALFALLACTDQIEHDAMVDDKLSATISVVVPQLPCAQSHTRAMALNPDIQNLYLAVFDDNGYLLEYTQAEQVEVATQNGKSYKYSIKLTPTAFPTTIHFIGNAPESIHFGTEVEAVGSLYTEGNADAYWQRVYLPEGIVKNSAGTLDQSVADLLTGVRLIRNFAWVQLKTDATNFKIDSYCVINTYDKGSVAPYNTTSRSFSEYGSTQTYTDLINTKGYKGFIPAGAELNKQIPDESQWFQVGQETNIDEYAYFIYEREMPITAPSFILVKGTYTTETGQKLANRYYKVDLRDSQGNYFPIIRNFRYGVMIEGIHHEGHASAEAAVAGAGSGDVSTAIETESFTNISNNVARLFVSYTDTTIVEGNSTIKLKYKFVVFGTDGNSQQILNEDNNVTINTATNGDVINSWSRAAADDSDGWREITITTKALPADRKSQEITIKGTATIDEQTYTIQRKVTLNLRPKYTMNLVCNPDAIPNELGSPFDLIIKVPGGLSKSMFPLELQLEAKNQSMTPNLGDDLPVVTGKSAITGKTAISFVKQLEWTEYDALTNEGGYKSVACHFKSNKAASATEIYALNKYFNNASTTLANYTPQTFSNLTFANKGVLDKGDIEVDFTFTMSQIPSQGYVTVALDNLEPAASETRLTYLGMKDGKALYSFSPTTTTETLHLLTSLDETVRVGLSAYQFVDATSDSWKCSITIPQGNINVGNNTNISRNSNVTFTLYTQNPGKDANAGNKIEKGQFSAKRSGSNGSDIPLTKTEYQAIVNNGGNVYIRFKSGNTYYVATEQLTNLLKTGGATLSFTQQK